ncbi:MAG: hypothetical protein AUG89_09960 [Acidobacteria bacterium 13_1_20CM_4_56_7]|nr:MAG: hypothetical protein AUG89_09960 [Acidobacteria bacterium 13_1_20CM_4_56_7]
MRWPIADRGDKTVTTLGYGFEIARVLSGVLEHNPNLPDGGVKAVLEIHIGFGTPYLVSQLLPCDHLPCTAEQNPQELRRLWLEL